MVFNARRFQVGPPTTAPSRNGDPRDSTNAKVFHVDGIKDENNELPKNGALLAPCTAPDVVTGSRINHAHMRSIEGDAWIAGCSMFNYFSLYEHENPEPLVEPIKIVPIGIVGTF